MIAAGPLRPIQPAFSEPGSVARCSPLSLRFCLGPAEKQIHFETYIKHFTTTGVLLLIVIKVRLSIKVHQGSVLPRLRQVCS